MQDLALELQWPRQRVVDPLDQGAADLHVMLGPDLGEPRRAAEQLGYQLTSAGVGRIAGVRGPQIGHCGAGEPDRIWVRPRHCCGRETENPADHVPIRWGEG